MAAMSTHTTEDATAGAPTRLRALWCRLSVVERLRDSDDLPSPSAYEDAERGRRWGWVFGAVWLFYLGDPLGAMSEHRDGPVKVLGYVALVAFAISYLGVLRWGRAYRRMAPHAALPSLGRRWLFVLLLLGLGLLTMPAAGAHGLATMVYVSATSVMLLPLRQGWCVVACLLTFTEGSALLLPHWRSEASGDGLGVLLAGLAVTGLRLALDRNIALIAAREEMAQMAVEAERERMARDMHDILGHSLTVITVKAELAGRLVGTDPGRAGQEIADVERLSREALADVRATISGYREVNLARELVNARSALSAAGIDADLPGAIDEVPGERRELFGWAVREGVTNVVRHSAARHCWVRIARDHVEVVDDGQGVADYPNTDAGEPRTPGHGLSGLRDRARQAGATLSIGAGDGGRGFRLRLDAGGA
jgi:two-component system, NarL family, sensor histidine kinase DesK